MDDLSYPAGSRNSRVDNASTVSRIGAPVKQAAKVPAIIIDRSGFDSYRRLDGSSIFDAIPVDVRLVTPLERLREVDSQVVTAVSSVSGAREDMFGDAAASLRILDGEAARAIGTVAERHLLTCARLRSEWDIAGPKERDLLGFRDKVLMKDQLAEQGVRVPEYAAYSCQDARNLLERHGSVIVKPRFGSGSREVFTCLSPSDLEVFERSHPHAVHEFEVEEEIRGRLYHVDSVVVNGEAITATAGHSLDSTTSFTSLRPFRDVSVGLGELLNQLTSFNSRVVAAFPEFTGVSHHEMFAIRGEIVFCEIACRPGGGGISAGFELRTGQNPHEVSLAGQLTGAPPPPTQGVAPIQTGFAMFYGQPGRVQSIPTRPDSEWVIDFRVSTSIGTYLSAPGSWSDAAVIASVAGENHTEILNRLDIVVRQIERQLIVKPSHSDSSARPASPSSARFVER